MSSYDFQPYPECAENNLAAMLTICLSWIWIFSFSAFETFTHSSWDLLPRVSSNFQLEWKNILSVLCYTILCEKHVCWEVYFFLLARILWKIWYYISHLCVCFFFNLKALKREIFITILLSAIFYTKVKGFFFNAKPWSVPIDSVYLLRIINLQR
jgi:hypothetical protein